MTKLSQAQTGLLQAAAASDGGVEATTETAKTAASLIKRSYLISIPREGETSRLLITAEGRAAIGGAAPHEPPKAPKPPTLGKGKATPPAAAPAEPAVGGKIGKVVDLLRQPGGATIDALMAATGWQAHSVRGAIAGSIKKKLKLNVTSEKTVAGRVYRIAEGAGA
jgi:hypothetical protein